MSKTYRDKERYLRRKNNEYEFKYNTSVYDFCIYSPVEKSFKEIKRKNIKAKIKQAIKNKDYENIPEFKKCIKEDWFMDR